MVIDRVWSMIGSSNFDHRSVLFNDEVDAVLLGKTTGDQLFLFMVLGVTGRNFAAGMSGGVAYVLDEDASFKSRCNLAMVELEPVPEEEQVAEQEFGHYNDLESHGRVDVMADLTTKDAERLHLLISSHARYTNSKRAAEILVDWQRYRPLFRKVMPVEYRRALAEMAKGKAATMQAAE